MDDLKRSIPLAALLALLLLAPRTGSAKDSDLASVFAAPIAVERSESVTSVPLDLRMSKLFLKAAANGETREFIFDTGSPTILTREFADALGLKFVGKNTGVDANGALVTMDVAVLESIAIGDTVFRNVPVLVFDYSGAGMGHCFLDGGVLGSELLPGSAWRIDTQSARLSIAESASAFGEVTPAVAARLYDFGYPHAPIVDYAIGELADKALFDTGNSEAVILFSKAAESRPVRNHIVPGSMVVGRGSEGESAGGRGPVGDLVRFTLSDFRLDGQAVGPVRATTRSVPPSLVGAGLLASYVVTLDYPGERLLLEPRTEPAPRRPEAGYSIGLVDGQASVVQLFQPSAAAAAGLKLGDRVTQVQGKSLVVPPSDPTCDLARWLAESFDPAEVTEIVVQRDGAPQTLRLPARAAAVESSPRPTR